MASRDPTPRPIWPWVFATPPSGGGVSVPSPQLWEVRPWLSAISEARSDQYCCFLLDLLGCSPSGPNCHAVRNPGALAGSPAGGPSGQPAPTTRHTSECAYEVSLPPTATWLRPVRDSEWDLPTCVQATHGNIRIMIVFMLSHQVGVTCYIAINNWNSEENQLKKRKVSHLPEAATPAWLQSPGS